MEMNTRLQVEHPVTEMITGLDLVEWQLRVAAGEPLPLRQEQLAIHGHAIEARIYAEDPARDFLPSIGRLEHLVMPLACETVRIDTGVRAGDEITPYYDPMIAKLIVHGATRAAAIEHLRAALAQYAVVGVNTNIEFLGRLMQAPSFVNAELDTALIERERAMLFPAAKEPPPVAWELAARATLPGSAVDADPWSDTAGWRLGARAVRTVALRAQDWQRDVRVDFGAKPGASAAANVYRGSDAVHVFMDGAHHVFRVIDPYLPQSETADAHGGLVAPMPGRVLSVLVKQGDVVARGAPLVIMEAMKMEHTVTAPAPGTVTRVLCKVGEQVNEGVELLTLEGEHD
jgi:3-methylcrotonyl-CoA carboxylase alpha subunit